MEHAPSQRSEGSRTRTPPRVMSLDPSTQFRLDGSLCLLHGTLHIKIVRCQNLRNFDGIRGLRIKVPKWIERDVSDPFVCVYGGKHRFAKTSIKDNNLNPVWDEDFYVNICHHLSELRFEVKDKDFGVTSELMGTHRLGVERLLKYDHDTGEPKRVALHQVVHLDDEPKHGSLEYFVEYIPKEVTCRDPEVPGVYFEMHKGNSVKLFVNADDGAEGVPEVRYGGPNDDEKVWKPQRLWREMYDKICEANHFIYITGWALDCRQSLLRGQERDNALKLGSYSPYIGELLKQKADEGVVVNMLVWDDSTSNSRFGMPGMMGTHDEESRIFFKGSNVTFRLAPMLGDATNAIHEKASKFVLFTHHQKLVILDAEREDGSGTREPMAFVGGLDLTDGRWDNHKHPLFRTLATDHLGDAYNKCFQVGDLVGPRQPWRDIHSLVRGPGVQDVLANFKERWYKQASDAVGELLELHRINMEDIEPYGGDGEEWCTQLFRSIDSRTCCFDRSRLKEFDEKKLEKVFASELEVVDTSKGKRDKLKTKMREEFQKMKAHAENHDHFKRLVDKADRKLSLITQRKSSNWSDDDISQGPQTIGRMLEQKKGRNVDASVHAGMVHHIRRAQHCIYIESQYFLGSSHQWLQDSRTKCGNLVPSEITMKICEKIAAGERFATYIVLPMWPEGPPAGAAVQVILYWQRRTIEGMYKKIANALARKRASLGPNRRLVGGGDAHPCDYLNFYCLATREAPYGSTATMPPKKGTEEELLHRTRRHQIYVHSKMMIVDDSVALIGSANVNQRSLDGARDSEILLGSYQPAHMSARESIPRGDVHGFRMHCWATTTGVMEDVLRDPKSLECVRRMNEIAEENWRKYTSEETVDMDSYLMPFPIDVAVDGSISARSDLKDGCFPDTKAKVLGTKNMIPPVPEILCT